MVEVTTVDLNKIKYECLQREDICTEGCCVFVPLCYLTCCVCCLRESQKHCLDCGEPKGACLYTRRYGASPTSINKVEAGGYRSAVQAEWDVCKVDSPMPGMMCGA